VADNLYFANSLIDWYAIHKRDLPWRSTQDPYKIWLSEIILQQTRVDQGLPYYLNFLNKYPKIVDLAVADQEEVLKLWEGLGYYSRAKNLHKCAKDVVQKHQGYFPKSYQDLKTLPGIGPYSAAAIASFAFKEPVAVLDGNVFRVLSRFFGIKDDIAETRSAKKFRALANSLIDVKRPDVFNQAIMEYGALQCKPQNPLCESCVLSSRCYAFENQAQKLLPVKSKKVKVSIKHFSYFVFQHQDKVFMQKRDDNGIWKGLYDFDLFVSASPQDLEDLLVQYGFQKEEATIEHISKEYKHLLTHQRIYATFYKIKLLKEPLFKLAEGKFYSSEEIEKLPKPVLITKYLNENIF
jgi:A/G-specific adenine glycosylase